jgi:hypothetical protein
VARETPSAPALAPPSERLSGKVAAVLVVDVAGRLVRVE